MRQVNYLHVPSQRPSGDPDIGLSSLPSHWETGAEAVLVARGVQVMGHFSDGGCGSKGAAGVTEGIWVAGGTGILG